MLHLACGTGRRAVVGAEGAVCPGGIVRLIVARWRYGEAVILWRPGAHQLRLVDVGEAGGLREHPLRRGQRRWQAGDE